MQIIVQIVQPSTSRLGGELTIRICHDDMLLTSVCVGQQERNESQRLLSICTHADLIKAEIATNDVFLICSGVFLLEYIRTFFLDHCFSVLFHNVECADSAAEFVAGRGFGFLDHHCAER